MHLFYWSSVNFVCNEKRVFYDFEISMELKFKFDIAQLLADGRISTPCQKTIQEFGIFEWVLEN